MLSELAMKVMKDFKVNKSTFESCEQDVFTFLEDRVRVGTPRFGIAWYPKEGVSEEHKGKSGMIGSSGLLMPIVGKYDCSLSEMDKIDPKKDNASVYIKTNELLSVFRNAMQTVSLDGTFFNRFMIDFYNNASFTFMGIDSRMLYGKNFGNVAESKYTLVRCGVEFDRVLYRNLESFLSCFTNSICNITATKDSIIFRCQDFAFYIHEDGMRLNFDVSKAIRGDIKKYRCESLDKVLAQIVEVRGRKKVEKEIVTFQLDRVNIIQCLDNERLSYDIPNGLIREDNVEKFDIKLKDEFYMIAGIDKNQTTDQDMLDIYSCNFRFLDIISKVFGSKVNLYIYKKGFMLIEKIKEQNAGISWF